MVPLQVRLELAELLHEEAPDFGLVGLEDGRHGQEAQVCRADTVVARRLVLGQAQSLEANRILGWEQALLEEVPCILAEDTSTAAA
jgi:hypothetical protein